MILQLTSSFEHAANPVLGTAQPDLHTKIRQKPNPPLLQQNTPGRFFTVSFSARKACLKRG